MGWLVWWQLSLPWQLTVERSAPAFFLLNTIFHFQQGYHNPGVREMEISVASHFLKRQNCFYCFLDKFIRKT